MFFNALVAMIGRVSVRARYAGKTATRVCPPLLGTYTSYLFVLTAWFAGAKRWTKSGGMYCRSVRL